VARIIPQQRRGAIEKRNENHLLGQAGSELTSFLGGADYSYAYDTQHVHTSGFIVLT